MTITIPTQVPSQITVPDWLVTVGTAYLLYVAIVAVLAISLFAYVFYWIISSSRRIRYRVTSRFPR